MPQNLPAGKIDTTETRLIGCNPVAFCNLSKEGLLE